MLDPDDPDSYPGAYMHVQIFKSNHGWYVRLIASNGEKLTVSEAYYSKWNAKRAARRVFPALPVEYVGN